METSVFISFNDKQLETKETADVQATIIYFVPRI